MGIEIAFISPDAFSFNFKTTKKVVWEDRAWYFLRILSISYFLFFFSQYFIPLVDILAYFFNKSIRFGSWIVFLKFSCKLLSIFVWDSVQLRLTAILFKFDCRILCIVKISNEKRCILSHFLQFYSLNCYRYWNWQELA